MVASRLAFSPAGSSRRNGAAQLRKEGSMKGLVACAVIIAGTSLAVQAGQAPMAKMAISSEEDYSKTMKEVGSQNGALRKAVGSSSEADAAAAATRLEALFKDVQAYWDNKKVDDASTAAKNAVAASQAIEKAVAAHDMAAANTAMTTLAQQCMACHKEHREQQPDKTYKMK